MGVCRVLRDSCIFSMDLNCICKQSPDEYLSVGSKRVFVCMDLTGICKQSPDGYLSVGSKRVFVRMDLTGIYK